MDILIALNDVLDIMNISSLVLLGFILASWFVNSLFERRVNVPTLDLGDSDEVLDARKVSLIF